MKIEFGVSAPPIKKQLGIKQSCDALQSHANAIVRLHVNGFLTTAEADRARRRLFLVIDKETSAYRKSHLRPVAPSEETK